MAQELVNTEFSRWAGKHLEILNAPISRKIFGGENASLSMERISVVGKGPEKHPGLRRAPFLIQFYNY